MPRSGAADERADDGPIPEDTPQDRARARDYIDRITLRLQKHLGYEPDDLARRLLEERPPMAALAALVALEDKLLKNPQNVRSPNCLLTTLLSAQNTRRELTKERSLAEVLERCDQRERSVVAKLERLELKKIQEELQANVGGATSLGPGNLPIHIAGRIYSLVKEGTPLSQLKDVYRNRYREEFEIKRWGFSKVTQLLSSIPGLTVSKLPDGRNQMTVVADDSTFHAALRRGGGNTDGKEAAEMLGLPPARRPEGRERQGGATPVTRTGAPPPQLPAPRSKPGALSAGASTSASAWTVRTLCDMGFDPEDSRQALEKTGGNVDAAIELLTTALEEPGVLAPSSPAQPSSPARGVSDPTGSRSAAAAAAHAADLLPQQEAALLLEKMRRDFRNSAGPGEDSDMEDDLDMQVVVQPATDASATAPKINVGGAELARLPEDAQVVVVEKQFEGMDDRQLSLAIGDQVELVSRDPSGWTYGRVILGKRVGAEGWFPHYVGTATRMKPKPQFPPPPPESPPDNEQEQKLVVATVTNTFKATEENQLSLNKGDQVEIVDKHPGGWTYCRIPPTGQEGWFPNNFLAGEDK